MTALTIADQSSQFDTLATNIGNNRLGKYDRGGQVKAVPFTYINDTGAALGAGSIVKVAKVANCRILPNGFIHTSALGASRVLDMGVQEYVDYKGSTIASAIQAILASLDVSSAVVQKVFGTDTASLTAPVGLDINGQADILVKVTGGTIPTNATIKGVLFIVSA